jgi:hypothetical protein
LVWLALRRIPTAAHTGLCEADAMERIAPIFAVYDLDAAREHYQRLGFAVRAYAGGGYGFASWHGVEIHLGVVPTTTTALALRTSSLTTPQAVTSASAARSTSSWTA